MLRLNRHWAATVLVGAILTMGLAAVGQPAVRREPFASRAADLPLYKRLDKVRDIASKLKIDGKGGDWEGIPEFSDPANDSGGDGGRDIINVAIAPRADDLLIMVETAQRPSEEDLAFWFNIDIVGFQADDIQLGLAKDGMHTLWVFEDGKPPVQTQFRGVEAAILDVVEVLIPYKTLAEVLPLKTRPFLSGDNTRPFVRVSASTYEKRTKQFIDYGPAVASFRLLPTPFALDSLVPKNAKAARVIEMPVNGKWYVSQGAFAPGDHQDLFAYDFTVLDHTNHPATVRDSRRHQEYMSWDQPVITPVAGRVLRVKKDVQDNPPRSEDLEKRPASPPNELLLDLGDNQGLHFAHLKRNSISLGLGQSARAGRLIGNVGNSGKSALPHLELSLWKLPDAKVTLPLALSNVRVSLNHAGEDPWAREFPAWDIREGYFVERVRK